VNQAATIPCAATIIKRRQCGDLDANSGLTARVGFVRSIGRWAMAALVVNCIIGSGIYKISSELTGLLGSASPLAMVGLAAGLRYEKRA
jgi:hypothetical protein